MNEELETNTMMSDEGGSELEESAPTEDANGLGRILDVSVRLTVELGRRTLRISDLLSLAPGSVVEFPKSADEPLDIRVNDRLIARGEAVVVGERYGIRVTEVVSPNDRLHGSGVIKDAA